MNKSYFGFLLAYLLSLFQCFSDSVPIREVAHRPVLCPDCLPDPFVFSGRRFFGSVSPVEGTAYLWVKKIVPFQ